jgi:hypothetical protein
MKKRGWLKNGNQVGDFSTAPRCGAQNRQGRPCQCPAMRGKRRCRLHGGKSTGPRTAAGIHGIRSAHWKDGSRSPRLQAECRADFARTHGSGVFFAGMITVRGICTGGPPDEWAAEPKNKAAAELGKRGGEARAKTQNCGRFDGSTSVPYVVNITGAEARRRGAGRHGGEMITEVRKVLLCPRPDCNSDS